MENLLRIYKEYWVKGKDYKGRLSRNDFWIALWWNIIIFILIFWDIMIYKKREGAIFGIFVLVVYTLANVIPLLTSIMRRYNDVGLPKPWLLITFLLPIILFIVNTLTCQIIAGVLCLINLIILMMPTNAFVRHH